MAQNSGLEAYRTQQDLLIRAVQKLILTYVENLQAEGASTDEIRDALIEYIPLLVEEYGGVSTELALEYYALQLPAGSNFTPVPATTGLASAEDIVKEIRYHAGKLYADDMTQGISNISSMATKHIRNYGRQTVFHNVEREGVKWARVPTGAKTCAFCLMLASRGLEYSSKDKAALAHKYHDDCDCEVARIGNDGDYPSGYLPDDALAMYQQARDKADDPQDYKSILLEFRRLFPDAVTDGVKPK